MVNINDINNRIIQRINNTLQTSYLQIGKQGLFDTQIIAVTDSHVYRETRDISNAKTIELPLQVQDNPNSVIAVAVGFYMIEASKVDELPPGCRDYFTEWSPEYISTPTALDLIIFTKDCDLLEERIKLVDYYDSGTYQLTSYLYEPAIYQDARSRVTDEHSVLDELILQLA
ncbi:hypothetical protein Lepto7375DRAFT_7198 [Leptolyngbya sp. PCC 7375]|nr:hypothetical protein Lepto7375DRAFT_7198 [Leptolyngbya sp. PCC 7375]